MPVVAAGAIIMGGMEVAGVGAAVLAGTATLAETFAVVGAIGAIAGGVGALTGNSTLTKIGMVMGAVGGVGALAASAGIIGGAAAGGAAADTAATTASTVADTEAVASGAAALPDAAAGDLGAVMPDAVASGSAAAAPAASAASSTVAPAASAAASEDSGIINGYETGSSQAAAKASQAAAVQTGGTAAAGSGGVFDGVMKIGGKIVDTVNDNKGLASILGQMGAGALSALNPKTAAETEYLKSQTALNMQRQQALGTAQPRLVSAGGDRPSVYAPASAPTYMQPNVTGSVVPGLINSGVTGSVV